MPLGTDIYSTLKCSKPPVGILNMPNIASSRELSPYFLSATKTLKTHMLMEVFVIDSHRKININDGFTKFLYT